MREKYEKRAGLFKAIAHPVRLKIISGLIKNECNVSRMQKILKIPQSTISQHLNVLKKENIIKGKRNKNSVCYAVISKDVKNIFNLFKL